jgi:hypothetical protein
MKRSHNTLVRHSLQAALCIAAAAYAALQVDLRSGFLLGFPDTAQGQDPVQPAFDLGGTLYGKFALGKDFNLSFEDQLSSLTGLGKSEVEAEEGSPVDAVTGASKKLPASEQNVPSENYGGVDLSYQGLRLGYRNLLYGRNRGLDANYIADYFGVIDTITYTYGFQYKRKMRQRYEGQYRFENERFVADGALYHIITNGAIDTMLNFTDYYNSQPITSTATRIDLMGGVRIPSARMKFLGGGRALLDHSAPSRFNSTDVYAMVEGNAAVDFHRLEYYLRTEYFSQGYLDDTLAESHAFTGFFQTLYLRTNISLGPAFMLKGFSVITFTENLIKQRYEVSLRKAWYNGSCIEAGASTTMGGYFPMVGYFIQSRIRPIDPLALSLRLKSVWDWPREDAPKIHSQTLFVKALIGSEVSYRLGSVIECYIGSDYTYFNPRTASNFPTRLYTGGGIRLYVP